MSPECTKAIMNMAFEDFLLKYGCNHFVAKVLYVSSSHTAFYQYNIESANAD